MGAHLTSSRAVPLQPYTGGPEADAFAAIVRLYGGMVYGTGLRITGDAHHAADVAQETFFQLLQNAGRITGSLSGWLHQVATRRAIDLVRRDSSRRRREEAYAAQAAVETDSWADISPLVDEALGELEAPSRDLIIRHFLKGERMVEIAAADGVSQPTISRRVEHALAALRERLRLKGVLVAATVLGGLLDSSAGSALPTSVMAELGKMSALSAGVAGAAGKTALGALKIKVAAAALIALTGASGYVVYRTVNPPSPSASNSATPATPSTGIAAVPKASAGKRMAVVAQRKGVAPIVNTNRSPASANRQGVRP